MNPYEAFERVDEKPLDYLVPDGGFSRILRTLVCVGDSLSSGEFEVVGDDGVVKFIDIYEHSWGQYLARMIGAKAYNFSKSGMSANVYCETWAEQNDFWNPEYTGTAYIIALGVNDLLNQNQPIGSVEDIDLQDWRNNKHTFAGYYGQIVQRYQAMRPNAKFFFITMPRANEEERRVILKQQHAKLMYDLAELFPNAYVLDFNQYAPVFAGRFPELFNLRGHMNPCGYLMFAQMVASYLDYIIRHNMEDFKMIGLA